MDHRPVQKKHKSQEVRKDFHLKTSILPFFLCPNRKCISMNYRLVSVGLLFLSACAEHSTVSAPPSSPSPKVAIAVSNRAQATETTRRTGSVTVALVIDQFAAWVARERLTLLPQSNLQIGGFARLRAEGTWYTDVRFAHAITETAVGHTSLHSGKTPREHGIVANELLVAGVSKGILVDVNTRTVTASGVSAEMGSSANAVQSVLVADRLKTAHPETKIYAFSLKDRGAIVGGGHHPDFTLWYDSKLGQFVTSTAFANELPSWVTTTAGPSIVQQKLDGPWTLLDAPWVHEHALTQDDQAGESNYLGFGTVFPHRASDAQQPFAAFRALPSTDRLLLDLALQALDHSPSGSPVFLAVSLSANDYIGHMFGPDSYEAWDELRRLDASLAEFFAELDRRQGADHWSLVLSADHGVLPLPEVNRQLASEGAANRTSSVRPKEFGGRILTPELLKIARYAAEQVLGKGDWVTNVVEPYLYWSEAARHLPQPRFERLRREVVNALSKVTGVSRLFDVAALPAECPPYQDESFEALVCRSVRKGVGGDYFIALSPGYFFDTLYAPGYGTSHGNSAIYDRSVPVLVRAPGKVATAQVVDTPQSFTVYSQLLGQLLDLP